MNFTKMQGTGNDFVVIEDLNENFLNRESELALKLCDRHYGIGADGILFVRDSKVADSKMVIYNSDGTYADMCGNGLRCFAKYVWEKGIVAELDTLKIETGDGVKEIKLKVDDQEVNAVTINMGSANFKPEAIPAIEDEEIINKTVYANGKDYKLISMHLGVPHTVVFGKLNEIDVTEGKEIENHELFPKRTNVNFGEVINETHIRVKTWERGAGATLACGTGSCATVVAANLVGATGKSVQVDVPGGTLFIEITDEGVMMTGPAEITFEGNIKL